MELWVCLVLCRPQRGQCLSSATCVGGSPGCCRVANAWSLAGAGTKPMPLRKTQETHAGPGWGAPGTAHGTQVLCSKHHHGRGRSDRHWGAQGQQRAPAKMTQEWGHVWSWKGCFPLHQALWNAAKPYSNLSCSRSIGSPQQFIPQLRCMKQSQSSCQEG